LLSFFLTAVAGIATLYAITVQVSRKSSLSRAGAHLAIASFMFHDIAGHEGLTNGIIGCGIRAHEALGPGLLESAYRYCMISELQANGYTVDTTRRVPVIYRGQDVGATFCPDLIVNDTVLLELKAVERLAPVHRTKVITYLKLTGLPVGLLMNFHVDWLKNGTRRIVRPDLYVRKIEREKQR
jgi:GxxExxY protein